MDLFRKHPLLTTAGAALALRVLFVLFFLSSPFRFYHCIPGLDMETLLRFGEWGVPGNPFFFTLHRLQVFLFWKLNGGTHPVLFHVLWQSLLGAAGAVLTADVMLKLTGLRLAALLAGVLWALNPVELMYEFTTLQDSLINFGIIFSVWSFLAARKHHFRPLYALGAGMAAGVAATGRPAAVGLTVVLGIWCLTYLRQRKLPLSRIFAFGGGIILIWLSFSTVNLVKIKTFSCFFNPVRYAVSINTTPESPSSVTPEKFSSLPYRALFRTAVKMASRIPGLWDPAEIPENLNIYFLQKKIPFFRIPFEFITVCAAVGILLLIFSGRWKKKEGFPLAVIFSLAFFLCIREPIGRYRLLLLPWFVLITAWLFSYCQARNKTLLFTCILLGFIAARMCLFAPPLRAADHAAWGWALEKEAGKTTPEALKHFSTAYALKPETNNAVALITRAIKTDNRVLAEKTAQHWIAVAPSALSFYYAALTLYPDFQRMKTCLERFPAKELPPRLRFRSHLMQGEANMRLNSPGAALNHYRSALLIPEGTPAQRRHAENMIKYLEVRK